MNLSPFDRVLKLPVRNLADCATFDEQAEVLVADVVSVVLVAVEVTIAVVAAVVTVAAAAAAAAIDVVEAAAAADVVRPYLLALRSTSTGHRLCVHSARQAAQWAA